MSRAVSPLPWMTSARASPLRSPVSSRSLRAACPARLAPPLGRPAGAMALPLSKGRTAPSPPPLPSAARPRARPWRECDSNRRARPLSRRCPPSWRGSPSRRRRSSWPAWTCAWSASTCEERKPAVPLTWFVGALTLSPAIAAILIAFAGRIRPLAPLVLGLAALGALVPAICLPLLVLDLASGQPIFTSLAGGVGFDDWLAAAYRLDSLGLYAALGIAFIVAPLLIWMAWQHGASVEADLPAEVVDAPDAPPPPLTPFLKRVVAMPVWAGLALALAVESAALTLVFSDNVLWLALAWIVLAAAAWSLGEIGSDFATLDRYGLGLMLAGPVLYALILFAPANLATRGQRVFFPR